MKRKLLIINRKQFGYHTDTYKYCEHLGEKYDIVYVCFDVGYKKLELANTKVKYVSGKGSYIFRGIKFILKSFFYSLFYADVIFLVYFSGCSPFRLLSPFKKVVLDVRTLCISKNNSFRINSDNNLLNETRYYDSITVISEGVRNKLAIPNEKSFILPLGSDVISHSHKSFSQINLLYVGVLTDRDIVKTVIGLKLFIDETKCNNITYDIIGDGKDYQLIENKVIELGLESIVTLHGMIPHFELKPFFDKCNVGISFIPLEDYYQFQPPTKTFEYILSGMVCIATKTYANIELINDLNGILCDDTEESFADSLKVISENFDSDMVRKSLENYTWSKIVSNYLEPFLDKCK